MIPTVLVLVLSLACAAVGAASENDEAIFAERRAALMREVQALGLGELQLLGRREFDPRVIEVMGRIPRHEFVPEALRDSAYANRPLPIGYGQTISQPYVVALMTDVLALEPGDRVLEVGTGSGYQAAILAELVERVFTIEIVAALGEAAAGRLARLGYENVRVRVGDGYFGWPDEAPFDAIIVTAAATHVPPPLVQQLKPGGRMVIPVGHQFEVQYLTLVDKDPDGRITMRQTLPVAFVPLTGGN
ncbi:MAG: protein-L-isoaspartate(D-aspartate) O-methyltransferase [Alphaproteobacteria bacterium]